MRAARATVALAALVACGGPRPGSSPSPGPSASAPVQAPPGVEVPSLERLDPAVRQQIATELARAREVVARGAPELAQGSAYGALGRLLQAYELHDSARGAYLRAQALAPAEFPWPYYLGRVCQSQGDLEAAAQAFEKALALRRDDAPALLALAEVRLRLGQTAEAEGLARRALVLDARSAAAHVLLAEAATARGDHAAAARAYEDVLALQPGATKLHQPLAIAYRSLGKLELAKRHLARRGDGAVSLSDPLMQRLTDLRKGTAADLETGSMAFQRGDFESAAAAYRRAVAGSPEDARAHGNLGSALWRSGDAEGAIQAYREALRLKPDDAMSHFNLGVVLAARGDGEAAIAEYQEAVRGNPSYSSARFNLANALRRAGRCEEARVQYAWIVEREPRLVPPRIGEIGCLVCLGKHGAALKRVEEGLVTLPGNPALKTVWARLLATSPDPASRNGSEALRLAREVSVPASAESLETLAMALAESGRLAEALSAQKAAIAEANTSGRRDLLARLSANLKGYQQGRACRDPGL